MTRVEACLAKQRSVPIVFRFTAEKLIHGSNGCGVGMPLEKVVQKWVIIRASLVQIMADVRIQLLQCWAVRDNFHRKFYNRRKSNERGSNTVVTLVQQEHSKSSL